MVVAILSHIVEILHIRVSMRRSLQGPEMAHVVLSTCANTLRIVSAIQLQYKTNCSCIDLLRVHRTLQMCEIRMRIDCSKEYRLVLVHARIGEEKSRI